MVSRSRWHLVVLVALLVAAPFVAGSAFAQDKVRIAVVDFDTEALQGSWRYSWSINNLQRAAADNLASELVKTGKFRVIERQQLDKVLREQHLGASGAVDPSTAARIGKVLGVQLVVVGSVVEFTVNEKSAKIPQLGKWGGLGGVGGALVTGKAALTARLVDTTTAEILGAFDGSGSHSFAKGEYAGASLGTDWNSGMASQVLKEAVGKLARDISEKGGGLTPSTVRDGIEGLIAKADGGKIYVNVGDASGIKVGDRFDVKRLGEEIKDPKTGEVLGGDETEVGTIEIVKVISPKLSEAKAVKGSGFQAGDKIVMK